MFVILKKTLEIIAVTVGGIRHVLHRSESIVIPTGKRVITAEMKANDRGSAMGEELDVASGLGREEPVERSRGGDRSPPGSGLDWGPEGSVDGSGGERPS